MTTTENPPASGREALFWDAAVLWRFTPLAPDVGLLGARAVLLARQPRATRTV